MPAVKPMLLAETLDMLAKKRKGVSVTVVTSDHRDRECRVRHDCHSRLPQVALSAGREIPPIRARQLEPVEGRVETSIVKYLALLWHSTVAIVPDPVAHAAPCVSWCNGASKRSRNFA